HIALPALRERATDIPLLVTYFIGKFNARLKKSVEGLEPDTLERLVAYLWPGNIRELENVVERAVLFAASSRLRLEDLSEELRGGSSGDVTLSTPPSGGPAAPISDVPPGLAAPSQPDGLKEQVKAAMSRLERELIVRALRQTQGNVTH